MKKNSNYLEIKDTTSALHKFGHAVVAPIFKALYFIKIKQKGEFPQQRCIVCANHCTMKDPIFLALSQKRQIFFMAKSEFFKNKFLAKLFTALGAFPVVRQTFDVGAISYAEELLEKEKALGIFIEGTRSKDGKLLPPKFGAVIIAYKTNSPIVPVSISQKNGKPMRLFHKVTINIGEPIYMKDLGIIKGTLKEMRMGSRLVMEKIKELRNEDVQATE